MQEKGDHYNGCGQNWRAYKLTRESVAQLLSRLFGTDAPTVIQYSWSFMPIAITGWGEYSGGDSSLM